MKLHLQIVAVIALFSSLSSAQPANHNRRVLFNILDYGARPNSPALSTDAFASAIAAARAAGGGTIYVPPGHYSSGPIQLFSNMTLDVDAGATIDFPVTAIPLEHTRYLGVETLAPMALIGARNAENVTVTGRGVLTTGLYADWAKAYGPPPVIPDKSENANGPNWDRYLHQIEAGQPISNDLAVAAAHELRPSFIYFDDSKNILVENVRIIGAPMFVVHLLYSENATVRNVMIEAFPGPHVNGIVVDSSRFVRISDDYIDTGDDGIAIKSGKDADGLRVNRPSSDVTITNCTVHRAHGAVTIGSETSGGIHNVTASNITAVDTENGIRIKSRRGRGGVVQDVRFDNFTMENVGTGIVVTSYYVMGGEKESTQEPVSRRTPAFNNIAISNVTIRNAKQVADIEGLPEMPIDSLRLTDVFGSGQKGLLATYTSNLELHDITVDAATGPAFHIDTATNALLDDITTRKPAANSPVLRLTHVAGTILRNSRAMPGTAVFLSTAPGELNSIRLLNNSLDNAATPTEQR